MYAYTIFLNLKYDSPKLPVKIISSVYLYNLNYTPIGFPTAREKMMRGNTLSIYTEVH